MLNAAVGLWGTSLLLRPLAESRSDSRGLRARAWLVLGLLGRRSSLKADRLTTLAEENTLLGHPIVYSTSRPLRISGLS